MYKLISGLRKSARFRLPRQSGNKIITRCIQNYNFGKEEEDIVHRALGNFLTVGINIPDTKNVLTETALEKLHDIIKNFEQDDNLYSIVLHGCGGNFCRGIVATTHAEELGQNLLRTLHTSKKPIIGALNGHTKGFGMLLAIMCDLRVIDEQATVGLYDKEHMLEIPSFIYERLVLTVGLGKATELISIRDLWYAGECSSSGFANKKVETGCSLGQAILWAQSIGFTNSLEKIIEYKSNILAVLSKKNMNE